MDVTLWIVGAGVGVGVLLIAALGVIRYKEAKAIKVKSDDQADRDARAVQRWASKESQREK